MRARSASSSLLLFAAACLSACGPSEPKPDGGVRDAAAAADAFPRIDAAPLIDAAPPPDAGPASGSYAYYFGDFDVEDVYQVARVDLGNRVRTILPLAGLEGGGDITGLAISPDNSTIVVAGRNSPASAPVLRLYPADGSGSGTMLFASSDSDRVISTLQFSPDGNWVAFLTDSELVGSKALHVVPVDASAAAKRVSLMPAASSQDVQSFRWAGDSVHIAFVGDLVNNNDDALWTVNATVIAPTITEIVSTAELAGRDVGRLVAFDSSDRLYFVADFELADNQSRLYRCAMDGTGRVQLSGTALTNGGGEASVGGFAMSLDGNHIAFASDSPTANLSQIFTLDLATSAPVLVSNITTAPPPSSERGPNFFEPMRWSPDGSKLTMAADWAIGEDTNNDFGAFVFNSSGSPGGVGLAEATIGNGDVFAPAFGADSMKIVFRGDLLVSNHSDLYLVDDFATSDQDPNGLLLEESVVGGTVKGFVVSR